MSASGGAPILSPEELAAAIADWRASGLTVGFTCGAFDLLHAGHADYLQRARELCGRLVVAVNSDDSVRSYKGPSRPIVEEQHRMKLVAALNSVDAVILMPDRRPARLLELYKPDLYIKGGDYAPKSLQSASVVEGYGGRTLTIPIEHSISTSEIIGKIQAELPYATPETVAPHPRPRLILLDRDGTILENAPFLKDPAQARLLPGVGENLRRLQDAGFVFVLVTNQQGIGLGYFDYRDFVAVNSAMFTQLSPFGVRVARIYYCPHSFADQCSCRKPKPGMIQQALGYFGAEPAACFLIGDTPDDMAAAEAAGCRGILLSGSVSFEQAADLVLRNASA